MSANAQFPNEKFIEALQQTKQLKSKLTPFLKEYEKMNISYIFDSLAILRSIISNSSNELKVRLNAIFALKIFLCTCNYVAINVIETYFIPILMRVATYDADKVGKQRGLKFFLDFGHKNSKDQMIQQYGFNAVSLATEMILAASIIKPRKTFFNEQTEDKSDFFLAFQKLVKKLKERPKQWGFFNKQSPEALRQKFQVSIVEMDDDRIDKYNQYVDKVFYDSLRAGFAKDQTKLDIREIIKTGDLFISQGPVEMNGQAMVKGKFNTILNCLDFYNENVISSNPQLIPTFHDNLSIQSFVKAAIEIPGDDKSLKRGEKFLQAKKFSPQQKKKVYADFLMKLQLWAHTFLRINPKTKGPSRIAKYYELLKNVRGYQFPKNPNLQQQIKEAQSNSQKSKFKIQKLVKEIRKQLPDQAPFPYLSEVQKSNIIESPSKIKDQKSNSKIEKPSESNKSQKIPSSSTIKNESPKKVQESVKGASKEKVESNLVQSTKKVNSKEQIQKQMAESQKKVQSSKVAQKVESPVKNSEPSIKDKVEHNQMESVSNSKINQTPGNQQTPSSSKLMQQKLANQNKTTQFKINLKETQKQIRLLMENTQKVEQKMNKLLRQKRFLQTEIETVELEDDQVQALMEECFKCIDGIDMIQADFIKYQQGKIQFEQLQSTIYKANGVKFSSKSIPPKSPKKEEEKKEEEKKEEEKLQVIKHSTQQKFENSEIVIDDEFSKIQKKQEPLKVVKLQIPISPAQEKVQFSEFSQSASKVSKFEENIEIVIPTFNEELNIESIEGKRTSKRKFAKKSEVDEKIEYSEIKDMKIESVQKVVPEQISPIKELQNKVQRKVEEKVEPVNRPKENIKEYLYQEDEDQFIEGPELSPLDLSYHEAAQEYKRNKEVKSFKDALSTDAFLKGKKGENLFWLKAESESLIKPASGQRKQKALSKINVPEIIEEKNKKFESQIKMLEQNKDKHIKKLEDQVKLMERERYEMKKELQFKESQINSLKQQTEKSASHQGFNIIQDIQHLMKKQKQSERGGNHEKQRVLTRFNENGKLLNTAMYQQFFSDVVSEKDKKKQLKNKQLFFKDKNLEVGCMGHREHNKYILTCYITPQIDMKIVSLKMNKNDNLKVTFTDCSGMEIPRRKQQKIYFTILIKQIPYVLPQVSIQLKSSQAMHNVNFVLPCGFQKFFEIQELSSGQIKNYFQKQQILRGQQIPYSKKVLKNFESIKDYLPHIKQLKDEDGEICFGGMASYDDIKFPLKVRIKPNQFMYVQAVNVRQTRQNLKGIEFYIGTLNNLLMKDISWN